MKEGRIHYIDALRGMTMLLVVYAHVMHFSLGMRDVLSMFFTVFRMPTFFFISGYIAYKAVSCWDGGFYWNRMKKKAIVQIVPAVFFFILFALIHRKNPLAEFASVGFGRFWFTIALFEMFCIYFTLSRLGKMTHEKVCDYGLVLVAVLGVVYYRFFCIWGEDKFLLYQVADYFQFFVLGVMCRKYNARFLAAMSSDKVRVLVWALFVLMAAVFYYAWSHIDRLSLVGQVYHLLLVTVGAAVGVLALFSFFKWRERYFAKESVIPRVFSFVGRRTLDIYLLHYFFLPDFTSLKPWFEAHGHVVLTFIFCVAVAVVVTGVALGASWVIRRSDFLGHYLLGAKRGQ